MASLDSDSLKKYQYLYDLDIVELENLLNMHTDLKPDSDDEFIECVLDAMAKKEQDNPTGRISSVEQAWSDFTNFYEKDGADPEYIQYLMNSEDSDKEPTSLHKDNSHSTRVKFLRRTLLVAAIVSVVITLLLPPALGYRNVVEMFGAWTEGQFYFVPDDSNSGGDLAPVETTLLNTEFPDLESALTYCRIADDNLPSTILESYSLDSVLVDNIPAAGVTSINALYTSGDMYYMIDCVKFYSEDRGQLAYEKTADPVTTINKDGITYYFFDNTDHVAVVWYTNLIEYSITGTITTDELMMLIDSI